MDAQQRHAGRTVEGLVELVEQAFVQRRFIADRRKVVAQPLLVLDQLGALLFQPFQLGALRSNRLPPCRDLALFRGSS